jgi:hypothetical protein
MVGSCIEGVQRGSGSGRAVYDDPCVGVGPEVLSESAAVAQAETTRRLLTRRKVIGGSHGRVRRKRSAVADAGRRTHGVSSNVCS